MLEPPRSCFLGQNVRVEGQEARFPGRLTNLGVRLRNVSNIVTSLRLRILRSFVLLTNKSPRCSTHLSGVSVPQLQGDPLLHLHGNVGAQGKKSKCNKEKVKIKTVERGALLLQRISGDN